MKILDFKYYAFRLLLDPLGGVEHNSQGGRRRRWRWKEQIEHVHAPPFQPICLSLNPYIGVRVMAQNNIALTFRDRDRSCRYNVGVRLKVRDKFCRYNVGVRPRYETGLSL